MNRLRLILAVAVLLIAGCSTAPRVPEKPVPKPEPTSAKREADKRIAAWEHLIANNQHIPEDRKLVVVNDFVNRFIFVDDIDFWKQEDYWATPLETVRAGGGDCEDFVIAKYFTLKYLNVPEERMRMTYVKAQRINKAHMVLSYYLNPDSEPLVLDNLDPAIKPASQRGDLLPVYSFNAEGLWLAKKQSDGTDAYVSDPGRISLWQKLLERMTGEVSQAAE